MTPDDPRIRRNHRAECDRAELIERRLDIAWNVLLGLVLGLASILLVAGGIVAWAVTR